MPILTKKLPAFTGVEKGVTATCKVPAGLYVSCDCA